MAFVFNPLSGQFDAVLNKASEIKYDNTTSGLTATNVQTALDEVQFNIDSIPTPLTYVGVWDASTNTPTLSNTDTGVEGFLYQVNVAGTVDFGAGNISFEIGDKVVNNGTIWEKWDLTDSVISVNSKIGIVNLTTTDIPEGTNLYFTDERAQDAVGTILTNTATVNLVYSDATPSISATVNDGSITDVKIASGIDAVKIADGSISNTEFQYLDGVTSNIQTQLDDKVGLVTGDISRTSFSALTTASPVDITGAAFANAVTRSFNMTMDAIGASDFATFNIKGIQRGSDWNITQQVTGDAVAISFDITAAGQLQYISNDDYTLLFKADTITFS